MTGEQSRPIGVEKNRIDRQTLLVKFKGFVSQESARQFYNELRDANEIQYLIIDPTSLVYNADTPETLIALPRGQRQAFKRHSLKRVYMIAGRRHPIRELTRDVFARLGAQTKLRFCTGLDEALEKIKQLRQA